MTDAPTANAPGEPALAREVIGAATSKIISAMIGDIALVLARSPAHRHFSFADIEWKILPPVLAGQAYIAEAAHKEQGFRVPIAAVTWARVSDEVDARLTANAGTSVRLRPDEWTGGPHHWLIDIVGDPRGINIALGTLSHGPFKDRDVKLVIRDKAGIANVETLAELARAGKAGAQVEGAT